ncbi:MAG: PQQ-dependent sugar dehydrogenase [Candidatus Limnocylindria bacterium]
MSFAAGSPPLRLAVRGRRAVLASAALGIAMVLPPLGHIGAVTTPTGFADQLVLGGLDRPTVIRFAPDGRVFVAEKSGLVKEYDSLTDSTPTIVVDLRTEVHNYWDRGLLGLALDPNFGTNPYLYTLYTYDHVLGDSSAAPRWGSAGATSDGCPNPPGATTDGCVVSGRLSRFSIDASSQAGPEQVLVEDWCQQFPSHSVGAIGFGTDGALYASGGEGSNFNAVDYGQWGGTASGTPTPRNPCGDPPGGVGGAMTAPSAEGGALRAQDVRTTGDPTGFSGAIVRLDPATGAALPDNPLAASTDAKARAIIGYGLRNPFRFAIRPGTSDVWIGDVGWNAWEEIDRIASPTSAALNFGWPCYEGPSPQSGYQSANLALCQSLYTDGGATTAYYAYSHSSAVASGDGCGTGSSSITGLAFENASGYPAAYTGALFFADYSRNCIWAMLSGPNGLPDPAQRQILVAGADAPVNLEIGPSGDLFYVSLSGSVHRITYSSGSTPTIRAVARAAPSTGAAPLTVQFDASSSGSSDPSAVLSFAWDFTGDGTIDSTAASPTFTYTTPGIYTARLTVTDGSRTTSDSVAIDARGNQAPVPVIDGPSKTTTWAVGQALSFTGHATDAEDGTLGAASLQWSLALSHCPSNCHSHYLQAWAGVSTGSFAAPDHQYPSYLVLTLTATDSAGVSASTSIKLSPKTAKLTMQSTPTGLKLTVDGTTSTTTFSRTVIAGSSHTVSAASSQKKGSTRYRFSSWSDGKPATHTIVVTASRTLTARYRR